MNAFTNAGLFKFIKGKYLTLSYIFQPDLCAKSRKYLKFILKKNIIGGQLRESERVESHIRIQAKLDNLIYRLNIYQHKKKIIFF